MTKTELKCDFIAFRIFFMVEKMLSILFKNFIGPTLVAEQTYHSSLLTARTNALFLSWLYGHTQHETLVIWAHAA